MRKDTMTRIMQENHNLYTVETKKTSLSPFNDKKYITKDGGKLKALSYGHFSIKDIQKEDQELIDILDDLINSA